MGARDTAFVVWISPALMCLFVMSDVACLVASVSVEGSIDVDAVVVLVVMLIWGGDAAEAFAAHDGFDSVEAVVSIGSIFV